MSENTVRSLFSHHVGESVVQPDTLRTHAAEASTAQLLLSAVHVTRDVTLLDRYESRLGSGAAKSSLPISMPSEGEPREEDPSARTELLDILADALDHPGQPPYLSVDDPEVFARMTNIAAGIAIDPRHVPMNREQGGFVPDQRAVKPTRKASQAMKVAIIGAGMTGIDAAVKATDRGFDYEIYEKESGLGGLWWSQTYPGVAVDTPCMYYSFSWEVTPTWSKLFPLGDEYRRYLVDIAEKYRLKEKMRFNSEITQLQWLPDEQLWELTVFHTDTQQTTTEYARVVIAAAGHLNQAKYPNLEGIDSFAGESIHSTQWRDADTAGKRVAVVGAGAAAVQIIASLTPEVAQMTVFQRQPHWISRNTIGDGDVSDGELWLRQHLPYYLQWSRLSVFAFANTVSYALNVIDHEWMKDHPHSISKVNDFLRQECLSYIHDSFGEGSELAQKLTPDFAFGAKRPVRDPGDFQRSGFYWALAQPHTDLVTSPLARVVPEGIVTADGDLHELDVIVWATGMTLDWLSPIEIIGRDGIRLNDVWADNNPRAYLGGTVPGFPNLFVQDGPNTGVALGGTGHNFMTETQNHYIFECLQMMVEQQAVSVEVTEEAHTAHSELIEQLMAGLIWNYERGADTYYRNEAGRIILPSPFEVSDFWSMNQQPQTDKFLIRRFESTAQAAG
jgi:4-hydroxyacetophenone monooxygenase